jgi:hypothetical protein
LLSGVAFGAIGTAFHAFGADLTTNAPVFAAPSAFETLPAVSGLNGKVDAEGGGSTGSRGQGLATGAVALPLSHDFGLQLDSALGSVNGGAFVGGAGHLFWRDPSKGLFGVYGSVAHFANAGMFNAAGTAINYGAVTNSRLAPKFELYLNRFSVEAQAGYQFSAAQPGFTTRDQGFYSSETLAYYPNDDLRLSLGHRHTRAGDAAAAGIEYLLSTGCR